MAFENLNCISGIVFYQVISELIWPYKTWYVHLAWKFIPLHIWLDMAISSFICIGTFLYQETSGLIWPYKTWIVYLTLYLIKLYMAWYGHMRLYMYIWSIPLLRIGWFVMAIWNFIFISGMVLLCSIWLDMAI